MIELSKPVYPFLLKKTIIITIIISFAIALFLICLRKKNLGFKKILFLCIIIFFLGGVIFWGNISLCKQRSNTIFNSFISDLKTCTALKVKYLSFSDNQRVLKEVDISNSQMIEECVHILEGSEYKWLHVQGAILNDSYIQFDLFINEENIGNFRIISHNILEISHPDRLDRYLGSDLELYNKIALLYKNTSDTSGR